MSDRFEDRSRRGSRPEGGRSAGQPDRFARRRAWREEAEESDLGREIRAREDEAEADESGGSIPLHSADD